MTNYSKPLDEEGWSEHYLRLDTELGETIEYGR